MSLATFAKLATVEDPQGLFLAPVDDTPGWLDAFLRDADGVVHGPCVRFKFMDARLVQCQHIASSDPIFATNELGELFNHLP